MLVSLASACCSLVALLRWEEISVYSAKRRLAKHCHPRDVCSVPEGRVVGEYLTLSETSCSQNPTVSIYELEPSESTLDSLRVAISCGSRRDSENCSCRGDRQSVRICAAPGREGPLCAGRCAARGHAAGTGRSVTHPVGWTRAAWLSESCWAR